MYGVVKVKALWNTGYGGSPKKPGEVFEADKEWAEKRAAKKQVQILEEVQGEKKDGGVPPHQDPELWDELQGDVTDAILDEYSGLLQEVNVEIGVSYIRECYHKEVLLMWEREEEEGKNRVTIKDAIEARLKELAGVGNGS